MLAKNALTLRRATPVGHRCMSALVSNVDQLAAQATKMEKVLPEMLKPLAADMVRLIHSLPLRHAKPSSLKPPMPWHIRTGMKPAVPASRGLVPQCAVTAGASVCAARLRRRAQGQGCFQPGTVQVD